MMVQKIGIVLALASFLGMSGCVKDVKLDAGTQDFYDRYRVFMTRDELQLLRNLPDVESRREFMVDFWNSRDPDPSTVENEFKLEVDERIEAANQLFRESGGPGYDTDRGRIYVLFGPPDNMYQRSSIQSYDGTGVEMWIYDRWQLAIPFVSKFGSRYRMSTTNPSLLEAINTLKEESITAMGNGGPGLWPEIEYDGGKNALVVSVELSQLSYRQEGSTYLAQVKVDVAFYRGKEVERVDKTEKIAKGEREFLDTDRFRIEVPLPFPSGKVMARVVVSDVLGNRRVRKIKTVRIK